MTSHEQERFACSSIGTMISHTVHKSQRFLPVPLSWISYVWFI